jgi:hypothetical protein
MVTNKIIINQVFLCSKHNFSKKNHVIKFQIDNFFNRMICFKKKT